MIFRTLLIVPLIWVHLACGSVGQPSRQGIAGVYRYAHGFASVEVQLQDDGTFVYRAWNDLGGWHRTEGTFRRLSPHILIANTSKPLPQSTITSLVEPYLQFISVAVRDDEGVATPGATVTLNCQESGQSVRTTDAEGRTSFPGCSPEVLEVELFGFRPATASSIEPGANRFDVRLALDGLRIDDEHWIVIEDQLFFAPHEPLDLIEKDVDP